MRSATDRLLEVRLHHVDQGRLQGKVNYLAHSTILGLKPRSSSPIMSQGHDTSMRESGHSGRSVFRGALERLKKTEAQHKEECLFFLNAIL